ALGTFCHRAYTEPVRKDFSSNSSSAIIDGKRISDTVERELEWVLRSGLRRILELRERLNRPDFVVVDDREFAKRLIPIRIHLGVLVRSDEVFCARPGDDSGEVAVNYLIPKH